MFNAAHGRQWHTSRSSRYADGQVTETADISAAVADVIGLLSGTAAVLV
jgi:hypothetical protein